MVAGLVRVLECIYSLVALRLFPEPITNPAQPAPQGISQETDSLTSDTFDEQTETRNDRIGDHDAVIVTRQEHKRSCVIDKFRTIIADGSTKIAAFGQEFRTLETGADKGEGTHTSTPFFL